MPDGVIRGSVWSFGTLTGWVQLGTGPSWRKHDDEVIIRVQRHGHLQAAQHIDPEGYARIPVPPGTYRVSVETRIPNESPTGGKYGGCTSTEVVPVRSGYLTTVRLACQDYVPTGTRLRRLYPVFQRHGNNRKPPPPVLTKLPKR